MKIGLDSNDRELISSMVQTLRDEKFFLVDMSVERRKNEGYEIYKKAILANATRLDLFIGVYLKNEINKKEEIVVFYDDTFLGKYFSNYIYDNLRIEYGKENLSIRSGENFYLLKTIKAPSLIIKGKINKNTNFERFLRTIIENIFRMENCN